MLERLKARRKAERELNKRWEEYQKNPRPGGPNVKEELPGVVWEISPRLRDMYLIRPAKRRLR
jgi:hypothetical protein